ncbi:MAG TPA: protein phosphatase 2C domain-containing protein [Candidatus Saccharimonadales bacterium]|nr:protein phosphatase 2C domain-containing protein [Candidatus Saccharimonadales bacterium]
MTGESREHKPQPIEADQESDELWFDQRPLEAEDHQPTAADLSEAPEPSEAGAEEAKPDELLPPYMAATGEPDGTGGMSVELQVKQDPRFTPEVIEAMKGPVDPGWTAKTPNGENRINLTDYIGSWADGAMDSMVNYLNSGKKTHLWHYEGSEGEENIVALDHIAFPEDRREKLEELGVQLDPSGFLDDMGDIPEAAYSQPEPGHDTEGTEEADIELQKDPSFSSERIAAMKGKAYPAWVEGDNPPAIELTNYAGSQDHGEGRGKTHFWDYKNPGEEEEIRVALNYVKFPQEKREKLEKLGIHLTEEGILTEIDPATEAKEETAEPAGVPLAQLFESTTGSGEEDKAVTTPVRRVSDDKNPQGRLENPGGVEEPPEKFPDGVTDDYRIYKRPSGLFVAQSKTYNRSKIHKSEIEDIPADETDKVITNEPEANGGGAGEPPADDSGEETPEPQPQPQLQPQTQTEMKKEPPDEPPNHEIEKQHRLDVGIAAGLPVHGEDTILGNESLELFGVFDGMGGMENGAEASRTAAATIEAAYNNAPRPHTTEEALSQVKHAMAVARQKVSEVNGFTTAVFGKVEEIQGKLYFVWGNAGDSRLFLERDGSHQAVRSISKEHVMPDGTSVYNALTPEPVEEGEHTRYVPYSGPTINKDDEFGLIEISDGDRIMLCTDGITGDKGRQLLTDKELQDAFELASAQQVADELVRISRKHDDKSVIVIDVLSA